MYREQWAVNILDGRSILDCALDVHMTVTGALERSLTEQSNDLDVLEHTLAKWRDGHKKSVNFDSAVRQLIVAALEEAYNQT
jgi:hypothetical protein